MGDSANDLQVGISRWHGNYWGTDRGTVQASFHVKGSELAGDLVLVEPGAVKLTARLAGVISDNRLEATLTQFGAEPDVDFPLPGAGRLVGRYDADSATLQGTWETDTGTNGSFWLTKTPVEFLEATHVSTEPEGRPPFAEPLRTVTQIVGAVRIDRAGLERLVHVVRDGLRIQDPAINATFKGREVIHVGIEALLSDPSLPARVDSLLIAANENAVNVGKRVATVTLRPAGPNVIYVSGFDGIWVEGKATQIKSVLDFHERRAVSWWRKNGSNVNGVMFLFLLALLPSIPSLKQRSFVVFLAFVVLILLSLTWSKAPHTRVYLRQEERSFVVRYSDWIIAIISISITVTAAYLIQRYVRGAH